MTTTQITRPYPDPTMGRVRAGRVIDMWEVASACDNFAALQVSWELGDDALTGQGRARLTAQIRQWYDIEEDGEDVIRPFGVHVCSSLGTSHDEREFGTVAAFASAYDLRIKEEPKRTPLECIKELFKHLTAPSALLVSVSFCYPDTDDDEVEYRATRYPNGQIKILGPSEGASWGEIATYPSYSAFAAECMEFGK